MQEALRRQRSAGRWILLGLAGVLVATIGAAAFAAMAQGTPLTSSGSSPGPCTPQPCLDLQGYTMWVSDVSDAGGVVRMQVRFRNSSSSTHAAPEDLHLIDSTKQNTPATQQPVGCTHWARTEFNNGASYGPITVCFQPSSVSQPLTLDWTPDLGLFCCEAKLPIR